MEQILFVHACGHAGSRTLALAEHLLGGLRGERQEVRLFEEHIPPLTWEMAQERDGRVRAGDLSAPVLRYARQFARADTVVVAAPYWDLLFPTVVRGYFEAVTVTGVTFRYTPEGIPEGLCRAGRLCYVTTAGGPIGERNFGFDYIRALSESFYGIPEVRCFSAEGLDIVGADVDAILAAAKGEIDAALLRWGARPHGSPSPHAGDDEKARGRP